MIVIIGNWEKRLFRIGAVILLIGLFVWALPQLTGLFYKEVPAGGWFQDEQPSGNPMRVEGGNTESRFDLILDQFVIKVQDFYYEE